MAFEIGRARALIRDGLVLAKQLGGVYGLAVAAYAGGGLAALDAVERSGFDVLKRSPRASRRRRGVAIVRSILATRR
jgi:phytoene/squalene synthetase